jgi:hypothetical protein
MTSSLSANSTTLVVYADELEQLDDNISALSSKTVIKRKHTTGVPGGNATATRVLVK